MNRTKLKNYAPQARRDFIQAMTDRAAFYGLTAKKIEPVVERGDVAVIAGREHPRAVAKKRKQLEERIKRHGFEQTMEAWPTHGSTGWSPSGSWNCTATWTTATGS